MFKYLIGTKEVIFGTWGEAVQAIDAARKQGLTVERISDETPKPEIGPISDFTTDLASSANVGSGPFPAPEKESTESQSEDIFSDVELMTSPGDLLNVQGSYANPGEFVQGPSIKINIDQITAEAGIKLKPEVEEVVEPVKEGSFGFKTNDQLLQTQKQQEKNKKQLTLKILKKEH